MVVVFLVLGSTPLLRSCFDGGSGEPPSGATTYRIGGEDAFAVERGGEAGPDVVTVLFLHGQASTSDVWAERGVLDALSDAGHRSVAVDLPGYGRTPALSPQLEADFDSPEAVWLVNAMTYAAPEGPIVVVSPSMSGRFSLPALAEYLDDEGDPAGFVAVAPVGIDEFERPDDAAPVRTLAVWGEEDDAYTPERSAALIEELGDHPGSRTAVIDGASHAAYDDHPGEFTALLLAFLAEVAADAGT